MPMICMVCDCEYDDCECKRPLYADDMPITNDEAPAEVEGT